MPKSDRIFFGSTQLARRTVGARYTFHNEHLKMKIRISKKSDVPLKDQIAEQIVFLIATGTLKPGEPLPSVRALSRQLNIHRNTVSAAYHNLAARSWLVQRRGSKVTVPDAESRTRHEPGFPKSNLDDIISSTFAAARFHGYSLETLRDRLLTRLAAETPDHILVVEEEPGLRRLLVEEIRSHFRLPVRECSLEKLAANPTLAIGALLVTPHYSLAAVERHIGRDRAPVPLSFGSVDDLAKRVVSLPEPSVVAAVSVSESVLRTARSLFAPAALLGHTLCEFLFPLNDGEDLSGMDLVFCDALAMPSIRHPNLVPYRAVSMDALQQIASAMQTPSKRPKQPTSSPKRAKPRNS